MADIGSLVIKIGADASSLQKAFQDLAAGGSKFSRGLHQIGQIASTAFFAATSAAVAMTMAAGKQAEELEQLSHVTGINTDRLQEYDVALNRVGLTGQDLAMVMKTISVSLDQARQGTGSAGDRFRQLGIDIRTVTSTDDLIQKVTNAAGRFRDGTQKAAIMSDLLGRQWQTVIKLFQQSRGPLDETSKALGQALSPTQLDTLTRMDDAIDDLMTSIKRFGQQLGFFLAPSIKFIVDLLKDFFAWGSRAFLDLGEAVDVFSLKVVNMAVRANTAFSALMSGDIFSPEGWARLQASMELITREEEKQIAKIHAAYALLRSEKAPEDKRPPPPDMIDTAKMAKQQQDLLDAQLKAREQGFRGAEQINRAGLANELAIIDQRRAAYLMSEEEAGRAKQIAMVQADKITKDGLERQLEVYNQFATAKAATFTSDQKGVADRLKFEEEVAGKRKQLENDIVVAGIQADTTRIQSGLQVKTFWMKQLDDLVASNAFSISQITTTWTQGLANSIVNGGQFIQAAWKQTQIALIQGGLNLAIQWGAQQTAMALASTAAATTTTAVWEATSTAITSTFALMSTSIMTFFTETIIPAFVSIGEAIADFLFAVAEAEADTIFGIPLSIGTLAAAGAILAAVGTLAAFAFAEGGIVRKPTMGLIGEAGPEAVVPLNAKGAAFAQNLFGTDSGSQRPIIHTHVYLKGREIALAVGDELPGALRTMGTLR